MDGVYLCSDGGAIALSGEFVGAAPSGAQEAAGSPASGGKAKVAWSQESRGQAGKSAFRSPNTVLASILQCETAEMGLGSVGV